MNKSIEENLAENGFHVSTTSGYSMYPMLRDRRDRVIIKSVQGETLRRYDLPLYKRPDGKYVLHRILRVKDNHYVIRGDNTYELERVPKEWVIGYVTEFYRAERHVLASSRAYRFYAAIWHWIYPLRVLYRKGKSFAYRVWRKIKRK